MNGVASGGDPESRHVTAIRIELIEYINKFNHYAPPGTPLD
jgi:hypothetical protein